MLCNSVIYLMVIPLSSEKNTSVNQYIPWKCCSFSFTNFKQCKNQPRFYTSFEWQIWETKLLSFCKTEVCSLFVFIFSHYRMIRYQIIKTFFEQWNVFWESMEYRVLDMLYVLFIVLFYLTENSALWCRVINWEFTTSVLTVLFLM